MRTLLAAVVVAVIEVAVRAIGAWDRWTFEEEEK